MPTFTRVEKVTEQEVPKMAKALMERFNTHHPLVEAGVRIDLMFAFGDRDENDNVIAPALKHQGYPALGIARKLALKDRAKGLGDAEICLDYDWWKNADEEQKAALLDHELHHIAVVDGKKDAIGRPVIKMRKHDVQVGWFATIAHRHAQHSQERIQAASIMETHGQFFWPEIAGHQKVLKTRMQHVETTT